MFEIALFCCCYCNTGFWIHAESVSADDTTVYHPGMIDGVFVHFSKSICTIRCLFLILRNNKQNSWILPTNDLCMDVVQIV